MEVFLLKNRNYFHMEGEKCFVLVSYCVFDYQFNLFELQNSKGHFQSMLGGCQPFGAYLIMVIIYDNNCDNCDQNSKNVFQNYKIISSMNTLNQPLKPVVELSHIFPDIQGELCSRHSTLFGKLRTTFNKLYDSLEPEQYIVVKGSAKIFNCTEEASLWMGLQNGLIIMVRKTYKNSKIFINGNHIDQELILSQDGKDNEGFHPQIDQMKRCLQSATNSIPVEERFGGIIYIHANIPEQCFQYRNAFLIGAYLSFLIVNSTIKNYTVSDMITNLVKCNVGIEKQALLRNFVYYSNRRFDLKVGENNLGIMLENRAKMVVCKFDVAMEDRQYEHERNQKLQLQKQKVLEQLKNRYNINSIEQIITNQYNLNTIRMQQQQSGLTEISNNNVLEILVKQMTILCQFSNNKITINDLLKMKWEIDSKYWRKFSEQVVQLIQNIQQQLNLDSCCVIDYQFMMIPTDKLRYTELLCKLRRKMHKGEMKSKSLFKIQEQLLQHRWGSDMKIGQKMFTSVPSERVAIFDPKDAIWFDDE